MTEADTGWAWGLLALLVVSLAFTALGLYGLVRLVGDVATMVAR